jgi:aminopeptidase N
LGASGIGFTQMALQIPQQATDGYSRQTGFDVLHYNLSLEVSDTNNVIQGKTIITIRRLDLQDSTLMLDFKSMTVASIQAGETAAKYFSRNGQIEVFLPPARDTLRLSIQYRGEPADGLYIRKNKFNRRTIFADNWPDRGRYWFPSVDHPGDKATVEFHITAPERYAVVANGRLEHERHNLNGTKTWSWREHAPIRLLHGLWRCRVCRSAS